MDGSCCDNTRGKCQNTKAWIHYDNIHLHVQRFNYQKYNEWIPVDPGAKHDSMMELPIDSCHISAPGSAQKSVCLVWLNCYLPSSQGADCRLINPADRRTDSSISNRTHTHTRMHTEFSLNLSDQLCVCLCVWVLGSERARRRWDLTAIKTLFIKVLQQ